MTPDDKDTRDLETILTEQSESDVGGELNFDRFMEGVIDNQTQKRTVKTSTEDSPQLRYNKLYRERAANRIRFTR